MHHCYCKSAAGIARSRIVRIGTWSVQGGRRCGLVLQIQIASSVFEVQNTLSGQVQLPVREDCSVRWFLGSGICIS